MTITVGLEEVFEIQRGLAEKLVCTLLLECQQIALNGADAGGRNVSVLRGELGCVFPDPLQERAEVLEVEQQQAVVVGDLERERQHARLRVVQIEQSRKQQGTHFADRRANRMSAFTEYIPENDRERRWGV